MTMHVGYMQRLRRDRWHAAIGLAAVLCCVGAAACARDDQADRVERVDQDKTMPNSAQHEPDAWEWKRRDQVHAFYSGHSLTDGIPERVADIARDRGQSLEFEVQVIGYSLLRQRTQGSSATSQTWDGYRSGTNRTGQGLDVLQELRVPARLSPGSRYDVLVVTERHDLPRVAASENTASYLADFARQAWLAQPELDVYLYHSWLPLERSAPQPWITYERDVLQMWECVASRANRELAATNSQRVHVLPSGAVLADLVELLWQGRVPGITEADPAQRVGSVFADDVHLSPFGKYFMGLVNYAALYGQAPTGSVWPGLPEDTRRFLEQLAYEKIAAYSRTAAAAAGRDMQACRALMDRVCSECFALTPTRGVLDRLKRSVKTWRCRRTYADRNAVSNPFGRL